MVSACVDELAGNYPLRVAAQCVYVLLSNKYYLFSVILCYKINAYYYLKEVNGIVVLIHPTAYRSDIRMKDQ